MDFFPHDSKKLRARIKSYERALKKPDVDDGYGKRFLVGVMYLLLSDVPGALAYYDWYQTKFPGDGVEPLNHVTWALALFRGGRKSEAEQKLLEASLENPHIWDWLYGGNMHRWKISYGTNFAEPEYLLHAPAEFLSLWENDELEWAHGFSMTDRAASIMNEQISIREKLNGLAPGDQRSALVHRLFELRDIVSGDPAPAVHSNVVPIRRINS